MKIPQFLLNLLKGLGKRAAVAVIQKQGDALQRDLKLQVDAIGPTVIDRCVDEAQEKILALFDKIKLLPESLKGKIRNLILEHGDDLQSRLKNAVKEDGAAGIDRVFDSAQALLIARIKAI